MEQIMQPLRRCIAVFLLISAAPLSALAPRSRIAKAEKPPSSPFKLETSMLLETATFEIAHITGESPDIVMAVLLSSPLREQERDALLREILYLTHSGVLPQDEWSKLKGLSLEQVIQILFHAAMHTRLTDPWCVSFVEPLDPGKSEDIVTTKPFNAQNIFQHPLLRSLPLYARGRIRAIAASYGDMDNMDILESLALLFTNPYLRSKALDLVEQYGMLFGVGKLKTMAWASASRARFSECNGHFKELAFLDHWSSHVDHVVALDVNIPNPDGPQSPLAQFDAIAVRAGKIIIHETKSVNPRMHVPQMGF